MKNKKQAGDTRLTWKTHPRRMGKKHGRQQANFHYIGEASKAEDLQLIN